MKRNVMMLAVLLVVAGSASAQQVTLKQDWAPGDYVMTVDNRMDNVIVTPDGREMPAKMEMHLVQQVTVADLPGGQKSMRIQAKEIRSSMQTPMGPMSFDSTDPAPQNPMMRQTFDTMLKSAIEVIYADGQIVEVRGVEKLGGPGSPGKEIYNQEHLVEIIKPSYLPSGPVSVGSTWTSTQDMPLGAMGLGKLTYQNTLKEIRQTPQGQVAVLDVTGTMTNDPARPGMAKNVNYTVKATLLHDFQHNHQQQNESLMSGEMELSEPGSTETMRMKQTVKNTVVFTTGQYQAPTPTQPQ